jgi:peptide-methionine (S)-S-oxide reductase
MKRIARISTLFAGMGIALAGLMSATTGAGAQEGLAIPAPALDEENAASRETAVFAGGCFWGVQGVFQRVEGVSNAVSGYAGGAKETAHYEMVGNGNTGHAEAVRVTFDPAKITYGKLLQVYFPSLTTRPSSTGKVPTWARNTARRSSRPARNRPALRKPISSS